MYYGKKDMKGLTFGKLYVLEDTGERYNREILWKCVCECGNICKVRGGHLRNGQTKSCGCGQLEVLEHYNNLRHKNSKKRGRER